MYNKETPNLGLPQWQPLDHPDFLTDFNEAFKKIDELGKVIPDNEKQQEQIDNLTTQIVDLTEIIKELEDKIDNMSDVEVILQMKEDIDNLKAEVIALTEKNATQDTSIGEITAHLTIIDSDITTIKQRLDEYKATIDSNTAAIGQNSQSITELENSLATLQTTVTNILTRLSTVEQLANQNKNNISEINTTMAEMQTSVSGAIQAASDAGSAATTAINTANLAHSDAEAAVNTANAAKATADGIDAKATAAQNTADSAITMASENSDNIDAIRAIVNGMNGGFATGEAGGYIEYRWAMSTDFENGTPPEDEIPWHYTAGSYINLTRRGGIVSFIPPSDITVPAHGHTIFQFLNPRGYTKDDMGIISNSQGVIVAGYTHPSQNLPIVPILFRESSGLSQYLLEAKGLVFINQTDNLVYLRRYRENIINLLVYMPASTLDIHNAAINPDFNEWSDDDGNV